MVPIDYTKFLAKSERMTLPYLGGSFVHAPDRRLRVSRREAAGWWVFEVKGRNASPLEAVDDPDLAAMEACPRVVGHAVDTWLFTAGDRAHRIYLYPEEEIAPFTPLRARRWHDGSHLYEQQQFEDEAEMAVRDAFIDGATDLKSVQAKGISPSLRAAFGYAALRRAAQLRDVPVTAIEVRERLYEVANGETSPDALLDILEARRHAQQPLAHVRREQARAAARDAQRRHGEDPQVRAREVLEAAGADLMFVRQLDEAAMEVAFRYFDEDFVAVVDRHSLHVYDAGICLDGADEELGLDALPSVIGEAMRRGELVILRRWR